jgi:hypothetical protein
MNLPASLGMPMNKNGDAIGSIPLSNSCARILLIDLSVATNERREQY